MKKVVLGLAVIVYSGLASVLLFGMNAKAYIDPSVITYLIQAVAGVVIAIGAVIGLYYRKVKRKIQEKIGVDEISSKEVESDEIVIERKEEK